MSFLGWQPIKVYTTLVTDITTGYFILIHPQGMIISNYSGASSAGAVFGTLSFLSRAITGCINLIHKKGPGRVTNVFGVYELVQPEPVAISEQEYLAFMQPLWRIEEHAVGRVEALRKRGLRALAVLISCVPFPWFDKKLVKQELRARANEPGTMMQDF